MSGLRSTVATLGVVVALSACSNGVPTRSFEGAPIPSMIALSCEFEIKHTGILNPDYAEDRAADGLRLMFTSLDDHARTAQMIGNSGTSTVEFRRLGNQLQFIEQTLSGNLTVTSVFAPPTVGEPLPAVHSRHIAVAPADIVLSQYAGSCTPRA